MSPKKSQRRGRAPSQADIDRMDKLGYATPGQIAKDLGVALTTVYGWIERDKLVAPEGDDSEPVKSSGPNVWVLKSAARALRPIADQDAP